MRKAARILKALLVLALIVGVFVLLTRMLAVPDHCRELAGVDSSTSGSAKLPEECMRDFPPYPP